MKIGNYTKIVAPNEITLPEPLSINEFPKPESVSYFEPTSKINTQKSTH
jgi:hypothetical protein